MASIDLPRALQDYFAFAETTATRNGRRFAITLPYIKPDGRLDRLQWWYHLSAAKEKALGDGAPEALRAEAISRFQVHVDRWLQNTGQVLYGDGAIPQLAKDGNRIVGRTAMTVGSADASDDMATTSDDACAVDPMPTDEAPSDETVANDHDEPDHRQGGKAAFG